MRLELSQDKAEDCLTITDSEDKLKTSFGSEIVLFPLEDAQIIVNELNVQYAIVDMLVEQLESYEDMQDIKYWIKEVRDEYV